MPHKISCKYKDRVEDKVKTLMRKRARRKGLIIKKIMQIKQRNEKRGSRTKLKFLHESLIMVKREAENLHEELMQPHTRK